MEHQFPPFPIILCFLLFAFMIWKKSKNNHSTLLNLPPGPWRLPVIGNLHQFVGPLPHHCFGDLAKKYGPLMHLQLGQVSHIVISSPEAAKEVMRTHDMSFASRPFLLAASFFTYNFTNIAFAPHGDYWRQVRKICTLELFSAKRVQSFRSIREEEASNLITSISSNLGLPVNLSKMIFSLINGITTRAAFGVRWQDQEELMTVFHKAIELSGGFSLADVFPSIKLLARLTGIKPESERLHQELDKILGNIINEHKEGKALGKTVEGEADDLVHVLLRCQENGELGFNLTTENIKAAITDIFIAGTDSSVTVIEWAMSEMMKNPRVMEKAQAEVRQAFDKNGNVDEIGLHELQYLKLVVKETLRLHTPLPLLLPRECGERCKILGYDIPKGSKVIVNAWAIARDPRYWNDAESFYPERFLDSSIDYKGNYFEYIPFGAGRRICPGMLFGMANIELPLAQLLFHFNWKLPNGEQNNDLDMAENFGGSVRRKNDLFLVPTPYRPPSEELK
ncbi:hypothetical protein AB3S75_017771 [Citrus x aurantiifolia]